MRILSASGLAMAAVLAPVAYRGGGDMNSRPALSPGDIRELTALSSPVETGRERQARQQEVFARSDSLITSTMHAETV